MVVVGGGVIGTATAYYLARSGIRVCLLEQNDIASGTSSAAAVAALLQTKTSAEKLAMADRSLTLLDEFYIESGQGFEYDHSGSLLVARSEAEMTVVNEKVQALQSLGLDVEAVDESQARKIMPLLGEGILGASYSPRDALINPLTLVTQYARAASQAGATIAPFTTVAGIKTQGEQIVAVKTDAGYIETDTIVNAAGVWAEQIARNAGIPLPITPLKGELLITEPMPPILRGTLISAKYLLSKTQLEKTTGAESPRRSVGITLAQVHRGNFVIGSTREQAGFDKRSTFDGIHAQCNQLLELTPALANIHLIRAYAGLRPITPDGLPIISRVPQLPGMIIASGFGGDGLALSAITGQLVLGMVQGKPDADFSSLLSINRFAANEVSP